MGKFTKIHVKNPDSYDREYNEIPEEEPIIIGLI